MLVEEGNALPYNCIVFNTFDQIQKFTKGERIVWNRMIKSFWLKPFD